MITAKDLENTFCYKDSPLYSTYTKLLSKLNIEYFTNYCDSRTCHDSSDKIVEFNEDFILVHCISLKDLRGIGLSLHDGDIYFRREKSYEVGTDGYSEANVNFPSSKDNERFILYSKDEQEMNEDSSEPSDNIIGVDCIGFEWTPGLARVCDSTADSWSYAYIESISKDGHYIDTHGVQWFAAEPIKARLATAELVPDYLNGKALFNEMDNSDLTFEDLSPSMKQKWIDLVSK